MNLICWILLLYFVRLYYQRKWRGKHPGDPLDLAWIKKRIDCSWMRGDILSCHFERPNQLAFLVQEGDTLEWHFAQHSMRYGWAFLA